MNEKSLFIGPYGENGNQFREMVHIVLEDIIQWRRNFHPSDERLISAEDKRDDDWFKTSDKMYAELDKLLGELKLSIPFHNPRFIGHMHADLAIPALLGYIAGQLYNQNNVVGESSPITTQKEMAYIDYLCSMVDYNDTDYTRYLVTNSKKTLTRNQPMDNLSRIESASKTRSTGHLTTGGTTANLEALWVACTLKYFPLSIKLFIEKCEVTQLKSVISDLREQLIIKVSENDKKLNELDFDFLFNLKIDTILKLKDDIKNTASNIINKYGKDKAELTKLFEKELEKCTVRSAGIHSIHKKIFDDYKLDLAIPVILVPSSRHYSWEKGAELLGLGSGQVHYISLDSRFRIDIEDYKEKIENEKHILISVGVVGSTEEGAVDPIHEMLKANTSSNKGFTFHVDAAYGGYYASTIHKNGKNNNVWRNYIQEMGLTDQFANIKEPYEAIKYADSITIDPHKMGYIPYSVGAILFRDSRVKQFILKRAPYLASDNEDNDDVAKTYLGGNMIEGSRSGAAALACYLTSRIIPNDQTGYGKLMAETSANAISLITQFKIHNQHIHEQNKGILCEIKALYEPDTNIVCYVVTVRNYIKTPEHLNLLTNKLYDEMSASQNRPTTALQFYVSKTEFCYKDYKKQIDILLSECGLEKPLNDDFELVVLRSVLMNPLINKRRKHLFEQYVTFLEETSIKIFSEILLKIVEEKHNGERYRILWIENKEDLAVMKRKMEAGSHDGGIDISRYINIDFISGWKKDIWDSGAGYKNDPNKSHEEPAIVMKSEYDAFIVDLNLADFEHEEWSSGIAVVKDIVDKYKQSDKKPLIIIYSQFLNPDFKTKNGIVNQKLPERVKVIFRDHKKIKKFPIYYLQKELKALANMQYTHVTSSMPEMLNINSLVNIIAKHTIEAK